jgi:hypothetical protein
MIYNFTNQSVETVSGRKTLNLIKLNSLVKNSFLANFISVVDLEPEGTQNLGTYNSLSKRLTVNANTSLRNLQNIFSTIGHETVHSVRPLDEAAKRSQQKSLDKNLQMANEQSQYRNEYSTKRLEINKSFLSGEITKVEYDKKIKQLESKYLKIYENIEKKYKYKVFDPRGGDRGRIPYYYNEEILAQTFNLKKSFNVDVLENVYKIFYNGDPKGFVDKLRNLIANIDQIEKAQTERVNTNIDLKEILTSRFPNSPAINETIDLYNAGDPTIKPMIDNEIESYKFTQYYQKVPEFQLLARIELVSGEQTTTILNNIKDPVWFDHIKRSLSNDLLAIEQKLGLKEVHTPLRSETPQAKKQNVNDPNAPKPVKAPTTNKGVQICANPKCKLYNKLNLSGANGCTQCGGKLTPAPKPVNVPKTDISKQICTNPKCKSYNRIEYDEGKFCGECGEKMTPAPDSAVHQQKAPKKPLRSNEISKKTSSLPDVNKPSTPKSTSAISKILPTLKKLFTELMAKLEKFNNSKPGRIFNYAMLAKDIYFVITLINKITEQIKNNEEVMLKDQLDLGLTIVSILTDQQTQAILRTVYPPISVLLNNPQVQGWLTGINIGANVLMGLVSVTDWIGSNIDNVTGEANPNTGTLSGILNVPGSAQALVMPVFHLFDKYGEVFNALVDVEKNSMAVSQAINKHIMRDNSGGIEPYRSSLFYKFRQNKDKIIAYQKSPAFKKLPVENQVLYPNANSPYAISSYKKARDARERERQEAEARRKARMPQE